MIKRSPAKAAVLYSILLGIIDASEALLNLNVKISFLSMDKGYLEYKLISKRDVNPDHRSYLKCQEIEAELTNLTTPPLQSKR